MRGGAPRGAAEVMVARGGSTAIDDDALRAARELEGQRARMRLARIGDGRRPAGVDEKERVGRLDPLVAGIDGARSRCAERLGGVLDPVELRREFGDGALALAGQARKQAALGLQQAEIQLRQRRGQRGEVGRERREVALGCLQLQVRAQFGQPADMLVARVGGHLVEPRGRRHRRLRAVRHLRQLGRRHQ